MIPATVRRVVDNTPDQVNDAIRQQTEKNIAQYGSGGPEAIDRRLHELDQEWDIERTLEMNAAALAAFGGGLALLVDRRFALVPLVVGSFLLQHALQGWCPPLPVFRRMGVRTQTEIEQERYALKALRGDFRKVENGAGTRQTNVLDAVTA